MSLSPTPAFFLERYLEIRISGATLPGGRGKLTGKGSQGCRMQHGSSQLGSMEQHTLGEFGRLQDCPCTGGTKVCRALCHSPLYKRYLTLSVGALANNSNGKLKETFGNKSAGGYSSPHGKFFNILGSSSVIVIFKASVSQPVGCDSVCACVFWGSNDSFTGVA